jgi:peroxiredoxin
MPEQSIRGFVLFTLIVLGGIYLTHDANLNRQAPAFSLPGEYGGRVDLDSYRGRPVLLVFWTTSCGICRRELPMLSQLAPEFQSKGVSILAIHLGGTNEARDYMSSNRIGLTSIADPDGTVGGAYHVNGVPKLVLIGSDGKIKRSASGWTDDSVLRDWVKSVSGS